MRVSDETVEKLLKQGGIVNDSQLDELKTLAKRSKQSLQETVIDQKVVSDEKLTKMIGELIDVPFVRIEPKDILDDVLKKIPEHIARRRQLLKDRRLIRRRRSHGVYGFDLLLRRRKIQIGRAHV